MLKKRNISLTQKNNQQFCTLLREFLEEPAKFLFQENPQSWIQMDCCSNQELKFSFWQIPQKPNQKSFLGMIRICDPTEALLLQNRDSKIFAKFSPKIPEFFLQEIEHSRIGFPPELLPLLGGSVHTRKWLKAGQELYDIIPGLWFQTHGPRMKDRKFVQWSFRAVFTNENIKLPMRALSKGFILIRNIETILASPELSIQSGAGWMEEPKSRKNLKFLPEVSLYMGCSEKSLSAPELQEKHNLKNPNFNGFHNIPSAVPKHLPQPALRIPAARLEIGRFPPQNANTSLSEPFEQFPVLARATATMTGWKRLDSLLNRKTGLSDFLKITSRSAKLYSMLPVKTADIQRILILESITPQFHLTTGAVEEIIQE